jgi:hypothetical protein
MSSLLIFAYVQMDGLLVRMRIAQPTLMSAAPHRAVLVDAPTTSMPTVAIATIPVTLATTALWMSTSAPLCRVSMASATTSLHRTAVRATTLAIPAKTVQSISTSACQRHASMGYVQTKSMRLAVSATMAG